MQKPANIIMAKGQTWDEKDERIVANPDFFPLLYRTYNRYQQLYGPDSVVVVTEDPHSAELRASCLPRFMAAGILTQIMPGKVLPERVAAVLEKPAPEPGSFWMVCFVPKDGVIITCGVTRVDEGITSPGGDA